MFANRLRRNWARLANGFAKRQIEAFRLYDRDIPEIRAVADWYAGHLVVGEHARTQTADWPEWLPTVAQAGADALGIDAALVHCKERRTRPQAGERYRKLANLGQRIEVREGPLRFWVNLDDYLDTGLFADHRETRTLVAQDAAGKTAANLFAYTGAFTVALAVGGAKSTVSVDTSTAYLGWLADNLALNEVAGPQHTSAQMDVRLWLDWARRHDQRFEVVVCDPPSFSERNDQSFDVQRDHRELVKACLAVLRPNGVLWFSCNHQRFIADLDGLATHCIETTAQTVPVDYRNRQAHRSWRLTA